MRSCVVCRTRHAKRELLRVVRQPDGSVVADPTGRLPGRGAYVCDDPDCRRKAASPGGLSKALGVPFPQVAPALTGTLDTNTIQEGSSGTK
ncbi:MAG TPA: YlxR family protein [Candidatus Limnocylindrales bacterium]